MTRRPAEVFSPGEYIRDELDARGWTQADLAEILNRDVAGVSQVLTGKRRITPETATGLAHAFGTSAEVWLNLDARFRLATTRDEPDIALRSKIYAEAPVREMVKRGWIAGSRDAEILAGQVRQFLGVAEFGDKPEALSGAPDAADNDGITAAQRAWLLRVRSLASQVSVPGQYLDDDFVSLIAELRPLFGEAYGPSRVSAVLAAHGVRFLVVENLGQTTIDGVCIWLDRSSPVIALTLREARIDAFWFTLLHEIAHLRNSDGIESPALIDSDLVVDHLLRALAHPGDAAANAFAMETLIPVRALDRFVQDCAAQYSAPGIAEFARQVGVHPGIVVGQLAFRGEVQWARFTKALVPLVRDEVIAATVTDGWGKVPPPLAFAGNR